MTLETRHIQITGIEKSAPISISNSGAAKNGVAAVVNSMALPSPRNAAFPAEFRQSIDYRTPGLTWLCGDEGGGRSTLLQLQASAHLAHSIGAKASVAWGGLSLLIDESGLKSTCNETATAP